MKNKRGQETIGMSFNMIFAIFLIVVFIVVAFIAIKHFLSLGKTADVGLFYKELQEQINTAWQTQAGEFNMSINLPTGITHVCFANLTAKNINKQSTIYKEIEQYELYNANTYLIPGNKAEGMEFKTIEHLNITKITQKQNPYCIPTTNNIRIKKEFYDRLVNIE